MNNIVFFFSGTGNSLKVAKTVVKELGGGEIVSMGKPGQYSLDKQYDTIGFIYPTYYWGLPKKVAGFIENLNLNNNKNAYYYSIATCGGSAGNSVYQLYKLLLEKHNIKLNNGQKLNMFPNYIVLYEMDEKVDEITKKSNKKLIPIINSIKNRKNNRVSKLTDIFNFVNKNFVRGVSTRDTYYTVNDNCDGCGICSKVCPVNNIEMRDNKPYYKHNCEQCVACIQYCPQEAINYSNMTKRRRRYTNPEISYKELSGYLK